MNKLCFEWDNNKNRINQQKHGISFEEAETVFYDGYARLTGDPDHSDGEERFVLLGMSRKSRVLIVCHCYRENDDVIRIISARKAVAKEHKQYRESLI